jgi:hypothetical protein
MPASCADLGGADLTGAKLCDSVENAQGREAYTVCQQIDPATLREYGHAAL